MEDRYSREREFHDRTFGENRRATLDRFYAVTRASRDCYTEQLLELCPGRRVLEYGCGPGSQAFRLARAGAEVTGIDISSVAITQAIEQAEREGVSRHARFLVMNAEQMDFESGSFDLICGTGILHHLDLTRAYAEVARTLLPDGCAIFSEPLGHNPLINLFRRLTPGLRTADEHPLLDADLEQARLFFGKVEVRYFHLSTLAAVPLRATRIFDAAVAGLDLVDSALFRALPSTQRLAWKAVMILGEPQRSAVAKLHRTAIGREEIAARAVAS